MLVKDPESAVFEPRYMPNYRVTAIFGRNRIEVQDERGNKSVRGAAHVKVCHPMDKVINQLPPQAVYEQYGRTSKLLIHPKDVPQVPLQLFNEQRQAKEKGEKETSILVMDDTPDESRSHTKMLTITDEWCESEVFTLDSVEEAPAPVHMCDKSRSRDGFPLMKKTRVKQFEVNVPTINLIGDVSAVVDTCDVSRSRPQTTKLHQKVATTNVSANFEEAGVDTGIDVNDKLKTRTYRSMLTVVCGSRQQIPDAVAEDIHTQIDTNDESRGRGNSCSMSTDQHPQQPVTSVGQGRNIEPTVVNMHDIDK